MSFCSNCGKPLADTAQFCSFCGVAAIKHISDVKENQAKKRALEELDYCKVIVDKVYDYIAKIRELDEELRKWSAKEPKRSSTIWIIIAAGAFAAVWAFFIGIVIYDLTNSDNLASIISFVLWPLVCLVIGGFIRRNLNKKARNAQDAQRVEIKEKIADLEREKKAVYTQIDQLLATDQGKFAKEFIPENYFYPEAVSMFIFYFRNGQADTMKEALREYDQYIHRCKLEYEAQRTAEATERSARASERAARAAEQSAETNAAMLQSMRAVEQWSASTHFWTVYNALMVREATKQ